jgi:uroporphyrinogen decarboxylase
MTDRERVLKSLRWDQPNSLVVENWISPATWQKYRQKLERVMEHIPDDFTPYPGPRQDYDEMPPTYRQGDIYTDPWGCVWECRLDGMQGIITYHPLSGGWDFSPNFHPPDPWKTDDLAAWDQEAFEARLSANVRAGKFTLAGGERLWERVHFLRGYENTLADLAWSEARLRSLIRLVIDYNIESVRKFLRYPEVDGIVFGDDWGEQHRLMVSPAMWREYFYEGYREMFMAVKHEGRVVYFHTDGYLLPVVPDLIAAGADVINLQSRPNGLAGIRDACLGRVTVSVDLDRQQVMPWGSPEEVKTHVRDIYQAMAGWRGGLWVKAGIFPDTPLENITALCEVFEELRNF